MYIIDKKLQNQKTGRHLKMRLNINFTFCCNTRHAKLNEIELKSSNRSLDSVTAKSLSSSNVFSLKKIIN
jgi:hypothetical protein